MQLNPTTVKSLRSKLDWTQQQLADACDVSLRTIQRVEKEGAASK
ncbi:MULTISPECIES: helix-turn-helix domain-containing protein [Pseudoalteromonas]|nr:MULTISPECIES: helix-turn-helix domain-containing protein [Pseudoalteromonas]ENO00390.1 ISI400 transposase B [Pseudoalteromonas agarivorans S816]MDI3244229.1 helix-turn-helix domain-containing protein [Pseudoalteromonas agarivorans]WRU72374.1 helix-turn-helix domain-containing protein [Pseudoalteromonas sp. CuT 4-3]